MSLGDDRRDRTYRELLGWPVASQPQGPAEVLAELRAFLAERRRRREQRRFQ